jgi:hypothetical protein
MAALDMGGGLGQSGLPLQQAAGAGSYDDIGMQRQKIGDECVTDFLGKGRVAEME